MPRRTNNNNATAQFSEIESVDGPAMSSSVPMLATQAQAPTSRRARSASTGQRRKKKPSAAPPARRANSLPVMTASAPNALRVKSQFHSLQTRGLSPSVNRGSRVEFAFLEVREFPIIL